MQWKKSFFVVRISKLWCTVRIRQINGITNQIAWYLYLNFGWYSCNNLQGSFILLPKNLLYNSKMSFRMCTMSEIIISGDRNVNLPHTVSTFSYGQQNFQIIVGPFITLWNNMYHIYAANRERKNKTQKYFITRKRAISNF